MVGDLIATPLGVAAMLNMMSIEGCYTDASPLILPQPHKGVANYYTHHVARLRGESLHSLSLICSSPRYVAGTPKGVLTIRHHITTKIEFDLNAWKAGNPLGGSGNIARGRGSLRSPHPLVA